MEVKLGFKCPFSLNRGVTSKEVTIKYKDYVNTFPGPYFVVSPE